MNQHPQTTTRIVAAVLDTSHLTIYKPDGETLRIPQGDPRIRGILDTATPSILRNGYADIVLEAPSNPFKEFEEKSSGMVRMFRVAKSKLQRLFTSEHSALPPQSVGTIPTKQEAVLPDAQEAQMTSAIEDIMRHAVPVASPSFSTEGLHQQAKVVEKDGATPGKHTEDTPEDTIIAVVDNKAIPGMEKISSQFSRAASTSSTTGMENLLKRLATVISRRRHSVEDLLKFLERGDLPIADDGSILIYKVLNRKGSSKNTYVDCHTGRVPQRVGSLVCMDESLVDPNRRNECSNGLHVARRGYVGGFHGSVCVLAKLAPEDVIAVPEYDANKMRVCGYHIIAELPPEMFESLKQNKPITATEAGKTLLGNALAGHHIGVLEEVRITGQQGQGVVVTQKATPKVAAVSAASHTPAAEALPDSPDAQAMDEPVNPKTVIKTVANLSRQGTAKGLHDTYMRAVDPDEKATALKALVDYKKSCKVGWEKLGVPNPNPEPQHQAKPKATVKPKSKAKASPQTPNKTQASIKPTQGTKPMTPREEIQHLLPKFLAASGADKTEFAKDILKLKQQAKKPWTILGVPEAAVESIMLRAR